MTLDDFLTDESLKSSPVLLGTCPHCQRYTKLTSRGTCYRRYCQRLAKHAREVKE